jgi:hypothetical protein
MFRIRGIACSKVKYIPREIMEDSPKKTGKEKILQLVDAIRCSRRQTQYIKKHLFQEMHRLENLQKKRETEEIEQEMQNIF